MKEHNENIVLLGPPGSGKGTQGRLLVEREGYIEFDTGTHLRQVRDPRLQEALARGEFAPTSLVMELYCDWMREQESVGAPILSNGIPRGDQVDIFLSHIQEGMYGCDALIWLNAPEDVLLDRLGGRRTCDDCNAIYHDEVRTPLEPGVCDDCGGHLSIRADDITPGAPARRIALFYERTLPVKAKLVDFGILCYEVDASRDIDTVYQDIERAVAEIRRRRTRSTLRKLA